MNHVTSKSFENPIWNKINFQFQTVILLTIFIEWHLINQNGKLFSRKGINCLKVRFFFSKHFNLSVILLHKFVNCLSKPRIAVCACIGACLCVYTVGLTGKIGKSHFKIAVDVSTPQWVKMWWFYRKNLFNIHKHKHFDYIGSKMKDL